MLYEQLLKAFDTVMSDRAAYPAGDAYLQIMRVALNNPDYEWESKEQRQAIKSLLYFKMYSQPLPRNKVTK